MRKTPGKKTEKNDEESWFIPMDARHTLFDMFKELDNDVILEVFTKKGENDPYNEVTVKFATDLAKLSAKIKVSFHTIGEAISKKQNVVSSPSVLINPDRLNIRYTGAPAGEEGASLIETIMTVSRGESGLSEKSKQMLAGLKEKRHVRVFVTLACPYCPRQVLNGFKAAIERPDLVSAECVDSGENSEVAKKHNVGSVPHTVINEKTISIGLEPEENFIAELVSLEPVKEWAPPRDEKVIEADLVIIGAGPAGLTAGIYAGRSGLKAIVLEKSAVGGQVSVTPAVENYPGFQNIAGKKLMDMITAHARQYVHIHEGEEVKEVKIGKKVEAITTGGRYLASGIILATGARYRKLGVPGEESHAGRGVSYCATCDGYLYKGEKVMVVGGGNTALTDALYVKNLGAEVTLVHRRDQFRAENHLQESVKRENIRVIWNTTVEEITGEGKVEGVRLRSTIDGALKEEKTDAVFVSIGEDPNSELGRLVGLDLSQDGSISIDRTGRTNIPRIYAAGDVTGGVRQIVTAVGEGATAAVSAFEDISNPYWLKKHK
jgi:thioredoxin reductase (NADPH)